MTALKSNLELQRLAANERQKMNMLETITQLRTESKAKHNALVTMAMMLTNVNTIDDESQAQLVRQLVDAGERDIADAIAEGGFAAALATQEGEA